jgi:hypothetical protein
MSLPLLPPSHSGVEDPCISFGDDDDEEKEEEQEEEGCFVRLLSLPLTNDGFSGGISPVLLFEFKHKLRSAFQALFP